MPAHRRRVVRKTESSETPVAVINTNNSMILVPAVEDLLKAFPIVSHKLTLPAIQLRDPDTGDLPAYGTLVDTLDHHLQSHQSALQNLHRTTHWHQLLLCTTLVHLKSVQQQLQQALQDRQYWQNVQEQWMRRYRKTMRQMISLKNQVLGYEKQLDQVENDLLETKEQMLASQSKVETVLQEHAALLNEQQNTLTAMQQVQFRYDLAMDAGLVLICFSLVHFKLIKFPIQIIAKLLSLIFRLKTKQSKKAMVSALQWICFSLIWHQSRQGLVATGLHHGLGTVQNYSKFILSQSGKISTVARELFLLPLAIKVLNGSSVSVQGLSQHSPLFSV